MRKFTIIAILTIFNVSASLACSCNFQGGFLSMASESQFVILAKIEQTSEYTMSVSVTEIFKGEVKDKITIIGDRGDQCLENIRKFSVGETYAFALKNSEGRYYLSNCGAFYVKIKEDQAHGMINHEFLDYSNGIWPRYNGKTMPLSEFRQQVAKNKGYPYPCKTVNIYVPNQYLEKEFQESKENSPDQFDFYKVSFAIGMNNLPLIEYFIEKYKLEGTDDFNKLAYSAIGSGNIDILKLFIEKGLPINTSDKYQGTLLGAAVGYPEIVKYLIEIGADVNNANESQKVPIMHAASGGCITSLQILLENNADVGLKDDLGRSAIDYAKKYNDYTKADIIELLEK